jgi:2'-5' RNA ligase
MPPQAKGALVEIQQRVSLPGLVIWERASNLHLTLKFLGDTSKEIQSQLIEQLNEVTQALVPFRLKLGRLGVFPRRHHLNVIWASVEGQIDELKELRKSVASVTKQLGFKSNSFNPHVTIGRLAASAAESKEACESAEIEACEFEVSSFALMKTEGDDYHSVAEFQLRS